MPRPIRHEVLLKEVEKNSFVWQERGAFMLVKNCEDQLCYLKLGTRAFYPPLDSAPEVEGALKLEAVEIPPSVASLASEQPPKEPPFAFQSGIPYAGVIAEILPRRLANKETGEIGAAGGISIQSAQGLVTCFFFSRPGALRDKEEKDWPALIGRACSFTFVDKMDRAGRIWHRLDDARASFILEEGIDAPGDAQETEPTGDAA